MCITKAQLFFGIYVKLLPLYVAAWAWPEVKLAILAIDLICARRREGTLQTGTVGTGVDRLPEEVWDMIKDCASCEIYDDAEHDLVVQFHGENDLDEFGEFRPSRLHIDHISKCDWCSEAFLGAGGMSDFVNSHKFNPFLLDFGLSLSSTDLHCSSEYAYYDMDAAVAVGLPLVAQNDRSKPLKSSVVIQHDEGDSVQEVTRFPPEVMTLPSDAYARFARLLAMFPLEPVDAASKTAALPSEQPGLGPDTSGDGARGQAAAETSALHERGKANSACTPSWLLVNTGSNCA